MLNAQNIADLLGCGIWVARKRCASWLAAQHDPRWPRVSLHRSGKRGRPSYRVDEDSFARWRRGLTAVDPIPQAA